MRNLSPLAFVVPFVLPSVSLPAQVQWTTLGRPGAGAYAHDSVRGRTVFYSAGQTWEFDGTLWQQRASTNAPASGGVGMAFDAARARTVLFAGGSNGTWEWDGNDWTQFVTGTQPAVGLGSAAWCFDSARQRVQLLISFPFPTASPTLWEWDGANWTSYSPAITPSTRYRPAIAYDSVRHRLVLFGGSSLPFGTVTYFSDTWEWDGTTWSQRSPVTVPPSRTGHTMVFDATRQRVVMAAGSNGQGELSDAWEWDGVDWTAIAPIPESGQSHTLIADPNQQTLFLHSRGSLRSWRWSGTSWNLLRSWPGPMADPAACFDAVRGRMVMSSGAQETWEWDGTNWWSLPGVSGPTARTGHEMAFHAATSRSLLFGGNDGTLRNDTWLWDGTTWQQPPTGPAPVARQGHAMTYDDARQRVVLFGGNGSLGLLGDTWELDGAQWLASFPASAPAARSDSCMAYDAARNRVMLFGGRDANTSRNDTWEWNGVTWTQRSVAAPPPARDGHAMTYNSLRQRIELFGGRNTPQYLGDTWEWDGTDWIERTPASSPTMRALHALVYDSVHQQSLLFGGSISSTPTNDLWALSPLLANATPFGSGCGTTPLALLPDPSGRPVLGQTARATMTNAPTPFAAMAVGWSKDFFGPYPLPVTLAGIGMTGCTLYQSSDVLGLGLQPSTPTTLTFAMAIPNQSALLGARLFLQGYALAPAVNPLGIVSSNALEWLMNNL